MIVVHTYVSSEWPNLFILDGLELEHNGWKLGVLDPMDIQDE